MNIATLIPPPSSANSLALIDSCMLADSLPDFSRIDANQFEPAIRALVERCEQALAALLAQDHAPSWLRLLHPLEEVNDALERCWSVISHLNAVANTPEVREAHAACLPILTEYSTKMGQHRPLFLACQQLRESDEFDRLTAPQQTVLKNQLIDFRLAGVDLDEHKQKRFAEIKLRLAELTSRYSNNVLDATQNWFKQIDDSRDLEGLPESAIESARALAQQKDVDGYVISLDIPSYLPVMQYCRNRSLREELYTAYVTRASELGPQAGSWDNANVMVEILQLRKEIAQLLGYPNYAALSIEKKMAGSVDEIIDLLEQLAAQSLAMAKKEYAELCAFANTHLGIDTLQAWDIMYASESMRLAEYELSQEQLKPYFPVDRVLEGLFTVVKKLFDIDIQSAQPPSIWHRDVRFYQLFKDGKIIAQCYLDLFARDGKRGGAWMSDCRARRLTLSEQAQKPVAFLVCNFTPPAADSPSLLTHNEVTTLFHEFGHGLHHMLTAINCAGVSGINGVAWDAVELPSQFLENWCWEEQALAFISGHVETGDSLPPALLQKMSAARNFQSAMQMVRQLEFAMFDICLHRDFQPQDGIERVTQTLADVRKKVGVYPVPNFNRFQNSFSHIFAGGYAAGYYSYKWAEVLSADAFSLFEEQGIFNRECGEHFLQTILANGGSEAADILFARFRGRAPNTDALLRHAGIAAASN